MKGNAYVEFDATTVESVSIMAGAMARFILRPRMAPMHEKFYVFDKRPQAIKFANGFGGSLDGKAYFELRKKGKYVYLVLFEPDPSMQTAFHLYIGFNRPPGRAFRQFVLRGVQKLWIVVYLRKKFMRGVGL